MSSYKDNFGKNEESERLGYDDSAFYFFACTILILVIVVYSYFLFRGLFFSKRVLEKNQKSWDWDTCQGVLQKLKVKSKSKPFSTGNILKFGFLAVLVFLLYASYLEAGSVEQMKAFDPFEILDIPHDADTRAIKKAFRRKSVETHPDKNPNDPLAASKFLQVTRAHQALTDEDSKENYKKYGNPDGPGPIKVAIGLPFFLMKKENQIVSLWISFLFILVVIPFGFFYWYSNSYIYTDAGLKEDDGKRFANVLNEMMSFEDFPKLPGWGSDFENIKIHNKTEVEVLIKLNNDKLNNRGPKVDKKKGVMTNYKCHVLLLLYMNRAEGIPERYMNEINEIVEKIPSLIDLWLEISLFFHINYARRAVRKNIPFKTIKDLMKFSQYFMQGMWEKNSELMQLPHIDTNKAFTIQKKMKKKFVSLQDYVELTPEDRKKQGVLSDVEMDKVEKWIKNLPKVKLICEIKTEGSQEIIGGDFVTVSVSIDREDLSENEKVPFVCSRTYPLGKTPVYHIFITDRTEKMIMGNMKLKGSTKVIQSELKLPTPPNTKGECLLKVFCFVDSYIGFDQSTDLMFTVKQYDEERDTFKYHEEDIKRDPSLFEQALQGLKEENSDDELESDSEGEGFGSKKHLAKKESDDEVEDEKDD